MHFGSVCILYDLLLLLNISFYLFSPSLLDLIAYSTTWITVVVTFCMIVIGYLNCLFPTVRRYDIVLHKKNPLHSELTFAVATDIHLGPINGAPHIQRIVRKIHALNPDIILLPGDILDGDLSPVIRRDLGSHLKQLQARYGVWGVTGNHEYIGGIDRAVKYLTDHGVRVLRDASVVVEGVVLIGRDDRAGNHIGSHERADLASILPTNYSDLPTVLMDHQPKNLADARELGVDVQFSGHTHNGQLFPLNYIVDMIFELGYGYKKKNNTHTFVSS